MSTTAEQTTAIPTGTWGLDATHSDVGFAITYSGAGTVRGGFGEFDAKLVDGKLDGSAKVASVTFDEPQLVGHLQSPDFFDAEQFPELRFTTKEIQRSGDDITIEGELTLRGVTKPVTITGTVVGPTSGLTETSSGSRSTSRPRSTAATSASTGTGSFRPAVPRSATT
jgi:polyisoprenoid-binding protein YceI